MVEAPKNTQKECLQLHFIPYLQSEMIPVFEAYLHRSNAVVKDVSAVDTSELPYGIGTKIILRVWIFRYRRRVEFGKY